MGIGTTTPAMSYFLPNARFDTIAEARHYLSSVLQNYKDYYRRGQKVKENCYWNDKYSIVVREVFNHDEVSNDRLEYRIIG